ncbi:hypothetical protein OGAPHI_007155 [Ogataea philodendri]|uniref:Uncharacterized protein n=1 Tax=Ogataea philodendri TaxID=1378263 RepID=A0A9P8NWX2_9ASCO|nr:uncharacterized protein OGAPHI_007155 [Ogataea philodendri]KAH3660569.1 hypothetical protein OGAPHI_007155 [Ogataea philodendri]
MLRRTFREKSVQLDGHDVSCTVVEFPNKQIVSLSRDGEMEVSYDLPARPLTMKGAEFTMTNSLIGGNLKTQALAGQIGQQITKNTIFNTSGKFFSKADVTEHDHELLVKLIGFVSGCL